MKEYERTERKLLDPPPAQRVRFDLERFEASEIAAWWHLNLDLTLEPASNGCDWLQWRIIEMPGWKDSRESALGSPG